MKFLVCFAIFAAVAYAGPISTNARDAYIVKYDSDNIGLDAYNFAYATSNGIEQQESGKLKNPGYENEALSVVGQYSYTGPDNVVYTIKYIADENGFQPQGAHIPRA